MNIDDFKKPTKHPFGMLDNTGLEHTQQAERFLAMFLIKCIEKGDINAEVKTDRREDWLCDHDILTKVGEQTYTLTDKSKKLLHAYYGKDSK